MGKVSLASANGFTLDLHGDRLISFLIENPNEHQIYDANGNPISAFVENMGTIVADGGQVVLTASAARGVVDSVINTDGVIQANTVARRGGKIILGGGTTGRVRTSGRIVARGNDAGEKGGEITIAGEKVLADAFAVFDAAGRAGGGKFMLGGDYRGGKATNDEVADLGIEMEEEPIQTAKLVVLEEGVQIDVSAIDEGDGGKLIVWSDEATFTAADLSARGGNNSGNGGFIETSGKYLQVEKAADASAVNGNAGTWLLDPLDITIDDAEDANGDWGFNPSEIWDIYGGGSFTAQTIYPTDTGSVVAVELIESGINNGSNVVVTTYGTTGSEDGDIRLRADIDKTSGGDARLSLIAAGDIRVDQDVEVRSTSGRLTFELNAAEGRIDANNVGRMDMNGGGLNLIAKDGIDFTSRRDMPDNLTVLLNNTDLGSSRRNVNIEFDDDIVNFSYSAEVADFRPGAITLLDRSSNGDVFIGLRTAVDGRLYDRAVTGYSDRGWRVSNFLSFGAISSNALNGIPEVEGYPDTFFDFLDQPSAGYVPVLEVSGRRDGTTDRYIVTAPAGHAILDDYLASLRPVTPVEEVVQEVQEVVEPFLDSTTNSTSISTPQMVPEGTSFKDILGDVILAETADLLTRLFLSDIWESGALPVWKGQLDAIALDGMVKSRLAELSSRSGFTSLGQDVAISLVKTAIIDSVAELAQQKGVSPLRIEPLKYVANTAADAAIFAFQHPKIASTAPELVFAVSATKNTLAVIFEVSIVGFDAAKQHNRLVGIRAGLEENANKLTDFGFKLKSQGKLAEAQAVFEMARDAGKAALEFRKMYPYESLLEAALSES